MLRESMQELMLSRNGIIDVKKQSLLALKFTAGRRNYLATTNTLQQCQSVMMMIMLMKIK